MLLDKLARDAETVVEEVLPELKDLPALFVALTQHLEAAAPQLIADLGGEPAKEPPAAEPPAEPPPAEPPAEPAQPAPPVEGALATVEAERDAARAEVTTLQGELAAERAKVIQLEGQLGQGAAPPVVTSELPEPPAEGSQK